MASTRKNTTELNGVESDFFAPLTLRKGTSSYACKDQLELLTVGPSPLVDNVINDDAVVL